MRGREQLVGGEGQGLQGVPAEHVQGAPQGGHQAHPLAPVAQLKQKQQKLLIRDPFKKNEM